MTEKELADGRKANQSWLALEIGTTESTVSSWFVYERLPNVLFIDRICSVFGVSLNYLIRGEEDVQRNSRKICI